MDPINKSVIIGNMDKSQNNERSNSLTIEKSPRPFSFHSEIQDNNINNLSENKSKIQQFIQEQNDNQNSINQKIIEIEDQDENRSEKSEKNKYQRKRSDGEEDEEDLIVQKRIENNDQDPTKPQNIVIKTYNKGLDLFKLKKFDQSLTVFRECSNLVKVNAETLQKKELDLYEIGCQQYIGSCLMHQKLIQQSIESLTKALSIIEERSMEKEPNQMYFIYNTMGYCYNDKKHYQMMTDNWENARQYLKLINDSDNQKNMGHLLNNLGMAYFGNNNLKKAQENFEQSVAIYQQIYGENDISVGNRMNNLAEAYRNDKQYDKAIEYFEKSLAIKKQHFKEDNDKSVANTLNNIGMTYQNLKQPQEAIDYFKQSIDIYKVLYGPTFKGDQASTIANVLNCLGDCYKAIGKPEQACTFFQESYNLKKSIYGIDHKNTMHTSVLLAQMLFMTKKYDQSVDLFKELLSGQFKLYGERSLQVGQTLNNLGTVLNALKQYEEAISHLNKAIEIFQESGAIPKHSIQKIKNYIASIRKKMQP